MPSRRASLCARSCSSVDANPNPNLPHEQSSTWRSVPLQDIAVECTLDSDTIEGPSHRIARSDTIR
jgi:hypothetical protein